MKTGHLCWSYSNLEKKSQNFELYEIYYWVHGLGNQVIDMLEGGYEENNYNWNQGMVKQDKFQGT